MFKFLVAANLGPFLELPALPAAGATSILSPPELSSIVTHFHQKKSQQLGPGQSYAAFASAGNCAEAQLQYAKLRIGPFLYGKLASTLGSKITSGE